MPIIQVEEAKSICFKILSTYDLPDEDKRILIDSLITAEMRGVSSHGLIRLPMYIKRIQNGLINTHPKLKAVCESLSCILLDGDNGLGQVVVTKSIDFAAKKASNTGVCVVSIFRSNHCGMLAFYLSNIIEKGFIGVMVANAPAFVAPPGGTEARIGTNPLCVGVPTSRGFPMILDMAICPAIGKVRLALQKGEQLPNGWAMDSSGNPTTNPSEVLDGGFLLPIGGVKGFGLGLMVDVFAGVLSGADFGVYIKHPLLDLENIPNLGQFIIVLDYKKFIDPKEFLLRIEKLISSIKNTKRAEGVNDIFLPGEIEYFNWLKSKKEGLLINEKIWKELLALVP